MVIFHKSRDHWELLFLSACGNRRQEEKEKEPEQTPLLSFFTTNQKEDDRSIDRGGRVDEVAASQTTTTHRHTGLTHRGCQSRILCEIHSTLCEPFLTPRGELRPGWRDVLGWGIGHFAYFGYFVGRKKTAKPWYRVQVLSNDDG